jgi:hypothetical protein
MLIVIIWGRIYTPYNSLKPIEIKFHLSPYHLRVYHLLKIIGFEYRSQ